MARTRHLTALASNLLATVLLAALLGLGIYVSIKTVVVEGPTTTAGYPTVNVNQTGWNIGCTVVGTAVGILATLGFGQLDSFLTRKDILSDPGVVALYLRPLTTWRSLVQVARGQLHATRTLLALLIVVSTLSSAATVAIFGIHNVDIEISNPVPSFPLADYNDTFFETATDNAYFPIQPLDQIDMPALEGFLYRASYIGASMKANPGGFSPLSNPAKWAPSSGQLGDTSYESLNTGGIGINLTSYFDFSGSPQKFRLPAAYTFNHLHGVVFGTHVVVECTNTTANYAVNVTRDVPNRVQIFKITHSNGDDFKVLQDLDNDDLLVFGAYISGSQSSASSDPVITIAIPAFDSIGIICDCTYSGREYQASIAVPSRLSDLHVVEEVDQGPYIGHDVKWMLANTAASFLTKPGGGSVTSAWTSTLWNANGDNNTDTAALLSTILSQTGEAQLSLMRQTVERSNTDNTDYHSNGSGVTVSVTIAKMGGGEYGWLVVYGLLLLGALLGVVRTFRGSEMTPSDVQNPVKILELMLDNRTIDGTTRLKLGEKIEILS